MCTFQPGEYLVKAGRPTDKIFLIKNGVCEKIREIVPLADDGGLPLRPATPVKSNGYHHGNGYANGNGSSFHSNGGGSASGRHSVGQSGRQANLEALGTITAGEIVWGQARTPRPPAPPLGCGAWRGGPCALQESRVPRCGWAC